MVMNLHTEEEDDEDSGFSLSFFLDKATLSNKELSGQRSWYHVLLVTIITILTTRMIQKTRSLAREAYQL